MSARVPALLLFPPLFFCHLAILGWGHLELLAEEDVEVAAAGEAAHLCDEADGFVGVGKHCRAIAGEDDKMMHLCPL